MLKKYAQTLFDGDFPGRKLVCTLDSRSVHHAVNITARRTAAFCADNSPGATPTMQQKAEVTQPLGRIINGSSWHAIILQLLYSRTYIYDRSTETCKNCQLNADSLLSGSEVQLFYCPGEE